MDVGAIDTLTNTSASVSSQATQAATQIDADFDTFLTLLTAQLNNQDPLQPIDNTEFVAQLAQFSAVEQQVRTNDTLSSILTSLGGGGASLGAFLGQEVEAQVPLAFSGEPIALSAPRNVDATSATLVVENADGGVVARLPVDPAAETFSWSGELAGGDTAEPGFYRFVLERSNGDETLDPVLPAGFARVVEARLSDGMQVLVTEGGGRVNVDAVTAIRTPVSDG